ncbi:hypothetical protein LTR09_001440 [Extremus antarcticus]|uniref:Glyoxalase/fosfomycin resistance/dioxygenase domain-containing protein n=1 Tax=Extremus antarcticus TaxID=702011 RepID=A0AAJ0GIR8_9PEZI|nr:hypothetical protein LTR09_001440 [Extremus antarcticus]
MANSNGDHGAKDFIQGLAHVNILVPPGTLEQAHAFYGGTLGLRSREVPKLQAGTLACKAPAHIKS